MATYTAKCVALDGGLWCICWAGGDLGALPSAAKCNGRCDSCRAPDWISDTDQMQIWMNDVPPQLFVYLHSQDNQWRC